MKVPFQAILGFGLMFFFGGLCGRTQALQPLTLNVSANPATFTSVGETITFTYQLLGNDYIDFNKGLSVTDIAADLTPSCLAVNTNELNCIASHIITAQDVTQGYVINRVDVHVSVGVYYGLWRLQSVNTYTQANLAAAHLQTPIPTVTTAPP